MFLRFAPLFVLAFVVGSLFRLGNQYDLAVLRMFGTQGIVVIGIWGATIVRRLQVESGIARVEEVLASLGDSARVSRVGEVRRLPVWTVHSPWGHFLLGTSDVANGVSGPRLLRRLKRDAELALEAAKRRGGAESLERFRPMLVLLRKATPKNVRAVVTDATETPVALADPEDLAFLLAGKAQANSAS